MAFIVGLQRGLRSAALFFLRQMLWWSSRSCNGACESIETSISWQHGQTVAVFAGGFATISVSAADTTLCIGRAKSLLLHLQASSTPDNVTAVVVTSEPLGPNAHYFIAPANTFRGTLIETLFRLNAANDSPFAINRTATVQFRDGRPELVPIAVNRSPESRTASLTKHIPHVLDLAARRQAEAPSLLAPERALVSFVVPVFNAPPEHLDDLLRSFEQQPDGLAELVFSDDGSTNGDTRKWLEHHQGSNGVSVVFNTTNNGISAALNAGIAATRGPWISFIDHDDALMPFCVAEIAAALAAAPACQFLYTDEIITNEHLTPQGYFLKPVWDPVLLSGVNYINHLSIFRRDRLLAIGGLRSSYDGSQDYDLLLRYTDGLRPEEIRHLPFPAYLWRRSRETFSVRFINTATQRARDALAAHFSAARSVTVGPAVDANLHRVQFDHGRSDWPSISVIIPSRDGYDLIRTVLQGLFDKTDYSNLDVVVIDNGTTDQRVLDLYEDYRQRGRFRAFVETMPFNFSAAINKGLGLVTGELVLILNNDIEVTSRDWLKEMASCFDYGGVGIVGAKLLYPSGKLQHAGVIAGLGGLAGHWYIGSDANSPGPMGRLWVRQTLTCVTGACMLISRDCLETIGGYDEANFAIAYNDIDFCLRATNAGYRVIWTPFACLIHHESASRGSDETPQNIERFQREQSNLRRLHATDTLEDRYFNPWYSVMYSHPQYRLRDHLPHVR